MPTDSIYELSAQKQLKKTKHSAVTTLQHIRQQKDNLYGSQLEIDQVINKVSTLSVTDLLTAQSKNELYAQTQAKEKRKAKNRKKKEKNN